MGEFYHNDTDTFKSVEELKALFRKHKLDKKKKI